MLSYSFFLTGKSTVKKSHKITWKVHYVDLVRDLVESGHLGVIEQACSTLHTPDSVQQGCLTFTYKINIEFLSINKTMCTSVCMVENGCPTIYNPILFNLLFLRTYKEVLQYNLNTWATQRGRRTFTPQCWTGRIHARSIKNAELCIILVYLTCDAGVIK
jgi:hypothetical protein